MHVPDGFLSPAITVPALAVSVPLWIRAARRHFGADRAEALPWLGTLTALAFVVQTIQIPVPGGTSVHLLGLALLALLVGPLAAFACESLVLLLQALVVGAGGLTVLGVNALAMGLAGPGAGWLVYRALRGLHGKTATFAAAYVSVQVSALVIAGALGLQHATAPEYFPTPLPLTLTALAVPSLLVTGPLEGLYTLAALSLLRKAGFRGAP
jgi:cobalt/nickel transport system permease protein